MTPPKFGTISWTDLTIPNADAVRDFYAAVASDDHVLTIQTADTQPWANLLLSVGCRTF